MKRNDFLQLSAFTVVAVSFPLLDSCNVPVEDRVTNKPVFLSRLFDEATIRRTGQAYLQRAPAENERDKLVRLLAANIPIADSSDEDTIQQYLEEKIKKDFDEGNTVMVNGWVLSVTEARQCALFSLTKS